MTNDNGGNLFVTTAAKMAGIRKYIDYQVTIMRMM